MDDEQKAHNARIIELKEHEVDNLVNIAVLLKQMNEQLTKIAQVIQVK